MKITKQQIHDSNASRLQEHNEHFDFLAQRLDKRGVNVNHLVDRLAAFQVAIPSWALGAGGTRFGRFSYPGEPANLEQKMEDVGVIHSLTQSAGEISLHIPWDKPEDYGAIKQQARDLELSFGAINSNTFQDQPGSEHSYKFGSLCHTSAAVRQQAVEHNQEVINIGKRLDVKSLTVWLADGSNFPGQSNLQSALHNTEDSLKKIYAEMPSDWKMLIEYKPYEPNFYCTVIPDWGTAHLLAQACGNNAHVLVDLGHHLPNTNIEQIVSTLMWKGRLGGFHFNDSKYGDDDLTVGSINPYELFRIFNELVYGMENNQQNPALDWMIDASHNVKDPWEDLIQSLEAIREAYTKALLVDQDELKQAQDEHDVVRCQEILQSAFRTDVRPLLERSRLQSNGAIDPIAAYREMGVRDALVSERGVDSKATGL